ncbi:hypothetical protein EON70_00160 [bacterium]|nr:MAG: hypothetical protein EON70_00160 [bacterium]
MRLTVDDRRRTKNYVLNQNEVEPKTTFLVRYVQHSLVSNVVRIYYLTVLTKTLFWLCISSILPSRFLIHQRFVIYIK